MIRKQVRLLRRKVRIAVVVGAAIYLAVGITKLGQGNELKSESKGKVIITTPTVTASVQEEITSEITECSTKVPEYQPLVYSYDWDAEEKYLLCKIAMAEAGNQDTKGKAFVMLVVLNRVWADKFPSSIEDVIYQPKQFSPVLKGTFDSVEPDEDCWDALKMVMSGWDESQGALYFESKSNSTWHKDNLKFLFKHQDHYFYTERD